MNGCRCWVVVLAVMLVVALPGLRPLGTAAQEGTPAAGERIGTLDLADVVLMPEDLEELGLRGFVAYPGYDGEFDYALERRLEYTDATEEEILAAFAGWLAERGQALVLPSDPTDEESDPTRVVVSYVLEHATADDAAAAFAFDKDFEGGVSGVDVEEIALEEKIGDEAALSLVFVAEPGPGGTFRQYELDLRVGNVTAAVTLADYGPAVSEARASAEINALALRLQEKMQAALTDATPEA